MYQLLDDPKVNLSFDVIPFLRNHPLIHAKPHLHQKYLRLQTLNINEIQERLYGNDIQPVTIFDTIYPQLLKEIYRPPLLFYCKGNLPLLNTFRYYKLAIVGAREHTSYGERAIGYLLQNMSHMPLVIVSGLAKGTDALAHRYALKNHFPTIGVLGFGHAHHYPKVTEPLRHLMETTAHGLTISEYPPFTRPARHHFPERNRIISGLCQGVLVTEAKERSGALITLDQALEQNRNVYVLPGDMFNLHTKGNLLRAKEGAEIVLSAEDILKDMNTSIQ
ncbi:DNA-processing protein DprA [Staphylococcus ratti]